MDQQSITNWTEERVIGILRELAKEEDLPAHLVAGPITGADTVETLGIDSLGAVWLTDRLEAMINIPLPDDFLEYDNSVATIAQRMNTLALGGVFR